MDEKYISIIIAAYNASATIARAVQSALQDAKISEVIMVDDASSDNTIEKTKTAAERSNQLIILAQIINAGPSAARNRAIANSTAPWIAVLDADDFFLPGRLQGLLQYSDKADLIADDVWQVLDNDIAGPRKSLLGEPIIEPRLVSFKEFVSSNISKRPRQRGELGFIKPLMRRSFLEEHKLKYQEHMRLGEDYELYARALAHGARLLLVPPQGYVSVVRSNSLSGQHTEIDLEQLRDCDLELMKIPTLTREDKKVLWQHYRSIDCRLQWRLLINAVKANDIKTAFLTFTRSHQVSFFLLGQLAEQIVLRTARFFSKPLG